MRKVKRRPAADRRAAEHGSSVQDDRPDSTEPRNEQHLLIVVEPVGRDRFSARLDGRLLLQSSRMPFLDAARALIAEGINPSTVLVMRHAGSEVDALRARLGV